MTDPALERHLARNRRLEAEGHPPTIPALLRAAAAESPGAVAVDFFEDGERLSYRLLDELSDRLANGLAAIGVRRGDFVAAMLPNRIEYPIAWMALAKLGAVLVTVNPKYTASELRYVLADSGARFLLIDEEHLPLFESLADRPPDLSNAHVVVRGRPALPGSRGFSELLQGGAPSFDPAGGAGDATTVLYTSGTTGFPKGCVHSQDYWLVTGRQLAAGMDPAVRRILVQNLYHYMNSFYLLLSAFQRRGTLFVARQPSASRFAGWVREQGIDWCIFPEFVLKQMGGAGVGPTLKEAMTAAWAPESHLEFRRRFAIPSYEVYGMTEIGGALYLPREGEDMAGSGTVGWPMLFRELGVRDEAGEPVPPGEAGELWSRGRSQMIGYHARPEANADSFRPGGWFRTGDLARADGRGFHFLVGRLKDMVRRAGENVAAREVEVVALMLPEVEDAAVVAAPDPQRGEEVKIFLCLKPGLSPADLPPERLLAHCRRHLAAFKLPRYVAYLDAFPRTASNKIEKGRLRDVPDARAGAFDAVDGVWR